MNRPSWRRFRAAAIALIMFAPATPLSRREETRLRGNSVTLLTREGRVRGTSFSAVETC